MSRGLTAWILGLTLLLATGAMGRMQPSSRSGGPTANVDTEGAIRERLRHSMESLLDYGSLAVGRDQIRAMVELPRFYERRGFASAWSRHGKLSSQVDSLLRLIRQVGGDGLDPRDYHIAAIDEALSGSRPSRRFESGQEQETDRLRDLDLLLSDAWLLLGAHTLTGRVHPETFDPLWRATIREADLVALLEESLADSTTASVLRALTPDHPGYGRLKGALQRYRALEASGGWSLVPAGPALRPGDTGPRVAALQARLCATGDLASGGDTDVFDAKVEDAVRRFQVRHGLAVDAIVGPATLAALNVSAAARCRQIELNLERWRWLPEALGDRHILVNIASFELSVRDSGREVLRMPVVVGREARRTPVFSDRMTYLVICPSWNVPTTIATQDILPAAKNDPAYLTTRHIRVLEGSGSAEREVEPSSVDWSHVTAKNLPYRFRQDPGPDNPLGRIKFMFPNRFDVYLHDSPARELFAKPDRTFSSGCIRVAEALALASYLLKDNPRWPPEAIPAAIDTWREQTVRLLSPIDLHLEYWTAWVDPDEVMQFRRDIYRRDASLEDALSARQAMR